MKNEEFPGFTSFDFITMVFSVVVIVAVSMPIIRRNFQSDADIIRARHDLGLITQAVINPGAPRFAGGFGGASDRSVASIDGSSSGPKIDMKSLQAHLKQGEWAGEAGQDPWGNAYHFAFLRNRSGMPTHVAVWSDGPNGKTDTSVHQWMNHSDSAEKVFNGDDLGAVIPLR